MKKSKNETAVVVFCVVIAYVILGIMGITGFCDWAIELMVPVILLIFLGYGIVQIYREEKPIYDRAKRIKALRKQNQQ